ncbi:Retinoid isomerohydrolase, variant 3 [Chamberlinius hualienensis]
MDLKHFFRSSTEEKEPLPTTVKGQIPEWLDGTYVRIGPGKFDLGDFTVNHWFDGYALLCNFVIKNGQVTFRSSYLRSEAYEKAMQIHRPVFTEFGTKAYPDPGKNIFSRIVSKLVPTDLTDNDVINVYQMCNELYCATESCHVRRVDPVTLDTLDKVDMNKVAGVNVTSAHPHVGTDGTGYNIGSSFITGLKYHIIKMPPANKLSEETTKDNDYPKAYRETSILANFNCRWKTCFSYYHSFGLSQNYFVFIEQPLIINSIKMATIKIKGRSYRECLEWKPDEKNRFVLIEKTSGVQVKTTYTSDSFFFFHHINTYEDDGYLVTDVITYRTIEVIDMYFLCNLRDKPYTGAEPPRAQRFVLPIGEKAEGEIGVNLVTLDYTTARAERRNDGTIFLTPEDLAEPGFELPQINYKQNNGKKYTYVYGSGCFEPGYYSNAIGKINVMTKEIILYRHCDYCHPGEAVFVARPGATEEDDG